MNRNGEGRASRARFTGGRLALAGAVALAALLGVHEARSHAAPEQAAAKAQEGVIDPKADAVLRRMSDYLSGLKSFRVEATTIDEKVTTEGQKIQEVKESRVALRRPADLRVDRVGPMGHVIFRYDGSQFSIVSVERKLYATAAAPGKLAAAIDQARDKLQIDAPGGDLLVPNSYESLIDGVTTGRYIGLEPIDGKMAHHLAMTKGVVDYQIWIQDGPEPLPLRYVITSKDIKSKPEFTLELRRWETNVPLADDAFAFEPPPGSKRVQFSASAKSTPQG